LEINVGVYSKESGSSPSSIYLTDRDRKTEWIAFSSVTDHDNRFDGYTKDAHDKTWHETRNDALETNQAISISSSEGVALSEGATKGEFQ
jgi:hypothetical protein